MISYATEKAEILHKMQVEQNCEIFCNIFTIDFIILYIIIDIIRYMISTFLTLVSTLSKYLPLRFITSHICFILMFGGIFNPGTLKVHAAVRTTW